MPQLEDFIAARVERLRQKKWLIPNAVGRQRLGRRQNLHRVGGTLITQGPEAAFHQFLCEISPAERTEATQMRRRMAEQWRFFHLCEEDLKTTHERLGMDVEYRLVCKLLEHGSFDKAMESMADEMSLWIQAYQSAYFNEILSKALRGEISLDLGPSLPMWVCKRETQRYYEKYCPEASPSQIYPSVRRQFLTPGAHGKSSENGPWRKSLIPVKDLKSQTGDGVWRSSFELRSGAYATTFLSLLFDLTGETELDDLSLPASGQRAIRCR
jgi:tRNA(Glu) U13 pseudouridine synthase TruD